MSELLFKICGGAVISAMLILLLKKWNGDMAVAVKVLAGVLLSAACIGAIAPIAEYVNELSELGNMTEHVGLLLRVLCVALITHVTSSVCRDCGEASLAGYAELGGKIEILILSLPLMKNIVEGVVELLNMS